MVTTHAHHDVLDLLRTRRSIPRTTEGVPSRDLIERVIEAAGWAPNHYKTEPWRFTVLTGSGREDLGAVMASALRRRLPAPESDAGVAMLKKERAKPLRAPVVIAVAVEPSDLPRVREVEEIEAGAAGVQNMLLAAHALGLGAMWRTGDAAYDPEVKRFLGLPAAAHIIAFVYLGYADMPELPERNRDLRAVTRWMGDGV